MEDVFEGFLIRDDSLRLEDGAGSSFVEKGDGIGDGSNIVNVASEISLGCLDGVGKSRRFEVIGIEGLILFFFFFLAMLLFKLSHFVLKWLSRGANDKFRDSRREHETLIRSFIVHPEGTGDDGFDEFGSAELEGRVDDW